MFDFSYIDPKLLFPNITLGWATAINSFSALLSLVTLILIIVAEWKLFKKFGEKSWKSLVPYYNSYIMYKHSWCKKAFWIFLVSDTLFDICNKMSSHLSETAPHSAWMTFLVLISVPFGIIAAVCSILHAFRLAEVFGKGKIFGMGLLVMYSVFVSIIGFGKMRYIRGSESATIESGTEDIKNGGKVV